MLVIDELPELNFNNTVATPLPPPLATTLLTWFPVAGIFFFCLFTNGGDIRSHWYDFKWHCCGPCNAKTIWPEEPVKVKYAPQHFADRDTKEIIRAEPPTSPLGVDEEGHQAALTFQEIVDKEARDAAEVRLVGVQLTTKEKMKLVQKQLVLTRKALKREEGIPSPHAKDFPRGEMVFGGKERAEVARKEGNITALVQGTDTSLEVVEMY
jgi:hypothetical protein